MPLRVKEMHMQPCDELKNIVLHHYGKFDSGSQSETIRDMYSMLDGVVVIGNEPYEWYEDRDSLLAWIKAGSSPSNKEIVVQNIKAFSEGTVGWTMDQVIVKMPGGIEIPIRHTRIFHKEDSIWKMVHLHVSVAVPNESVGS